MCVCACAHAALIMSLPGAQILISKCRSLLKGTRAAWELVDSRAEKAKDNPGVSYCSRKLQSTQRMKGYIKMTKKH